MTNKENTLLQKYRDFPVQVKAAFWFLICSFMQKGISVITTPIFTRLMNTEQYGQYGAFTSWLNIITIVVSLSLYWGVHAQGIVKYEDDSHAFSSSMQGLMTVLVSGWTVIYLMFRSFWNKLFSLTTVQMLALLVMVWMTAVFNFWANEQRVTYSYKKLVAITVIVSLLKPILEIVLILNSEDKVTARVLGIALAEIIGYFWMYIYQIRKGKVFFSRKYWKYALGFNIPLVPHYLSQVVLNSADRIMIKDMVGSSEAGIYTLAYSIALVMTLFNSALAQTLGPWMYKRIKTQKIDDLAPIAYTSLIIIACVNVALIIFAPEVVAIFAPAEYYEAIWVIPPVAMSTYFMFSYELFAKFAFYYEKTKFIMIASSICAITNIVLNYFGIKAYGYLAAGYTTLICYFLYSLAHYLFMNRVCTKYCSLYNPYQTTVLLAITGAFLVIGMGLIATYRHPIARYTIALSMLIIIIIKRKTIINVIKSILVLKKQ